MSQCDNENAEILERLRQDAKPVSEITSYSSGRGIYAFFLRDTGLCVGCQNLQQETLLYLGKTESSQRKRDAGQHLSNSRTGQSTVRRSLGALLRKELKLKPKPRSDSENSDKRFIHFKFSDPGEVDLTTWMEDHLSLGFYESRDWTIKELRDREKELIRAAKPALNLLHNLEGPYYAELKSTREDCARMAQGLEVGIRPKS